jgi:hypothetical protein
VAPPPGIRQTIGQAVPSTQIMPEEHLDEADKERKAEADKLMEEFLQARRQERAKTSQTPGAGVHSQP